MRPGRRAASAKVVRSRNHKNSPNDAKPAWKPKPMKTKSGHPVQRVRIDELSPLIATYFEINQLKQLYRQGWLQRGVSPDQCESVADHVFAVTILAIFIADAHFPDLDSHRIARMAILHDIGEIYAGDITPQDDVDSTEKYRRESESVARVLAKLPQGQTYIEIWQEYETQSTPEARFVRQIDRLEMALQAKAYELDDDAPCLTEFIDCADGAIDLPQLQAMITELRSLAPGT